MQTCPGFFLKSPLELPGNLLEICSVQFVDTLSSSFVCLSAELLDCGWVNFMRFLLGVTVSVGTRKNSLDCGNSQTTEKVRYLYDKALLLSADS